MLTRKDFIKKADEIINIINVHNSKKGYKPFISIDTFDISMMVKEYSQIAKKSNERFDEQRFRDYIEVGIYGNTV